MSRHLDTAYKRFFQKLGGLPVFKKRRSAQSVTLTTDGFSLKGDRVYLAKIGTIKPISSAPSSVTVIKDCAGRYFVSFVSVPAKFPSIGIDLGIKTFAVTSDG
jgi:putative transposase